MEVYFDNPEGGMELIYTGATVSEIDTLFEDFKLGVWVGNDVCRDVDSWNLNYGINDKFELYAMFSIAD